MILALDATEMVAGPELVGELAQSGVEIEWVAELASLLPGARAWIRWQGCRRWSSASFRSSAGTAS